MAVGNITNYETSLGCSTSGLSIACPVGGADGWYSDGTYSYYVSNGTVQSINYDPCAAPPPPPPPAVTWTAVSLGKRGTSASTACSNANNIGLDVTYYMNDSTYASSTALALYSDGTGTPADGYWSNGAIARQVSSGGLSGNTICSI